MKIHANVSSVVALSRGPAGISSYDVLQPSLETPELSHRTGPASVALHMVRQLFRNWRLDEGTFGTANWNPLGELIPAGSRVVIKPNWVYHAARGPGSMDSLVTHTSVILAVLEYVALTRPVAVVVGDAPVQGCDFAALRANRRIDSLAEWANARGMPLDIVDFRRTVNVMGGSVGAKQEDVRPIEKFVLFDLERASALTPLDEDADKFRVTAYDPSKLAETHQPGRHRYLVAREVIDADVVINIPKLKCHQKSGVTGALKNIVGINGHKEYLPHHRKGGSKAGGDCYAGTVFWKRWMENALDVANSPNRPFWSRWLLDRLVVSSRKLVKLSGADDNIEGGWHGNDTVWRMCFDLNRILEFGDANGRLQQLSQRKIIHITDAIVAGEGDGPLLATPVPSGFITGSISAAAAEYVHSRLMGLDPELIPIVCQAFRNKTWRLVDFDPFSIQVRDDSADCRGTDIAPICNFRPPRGWVGHCELKPTNVPVDTDLARL